MKLLIFSNHTRKRPNAGNLKLIQVTQSYIIHIKPVEGIATSYLQMLLRIKRPSRTALDKIETVSEDCEFKIEISLSLISHCSCAPILLTASSNIAYLFLATHWKHTELNKFYAIWYDAAISVFAINCEFRQVQIMLISLFWCQCSLSVETDTAPPTY